jgi:acyl-CoA synthetase (AMP-forming)/AMP-acid ligase II
LVTLRPEVALNADEIIAYTRQKVAAYKAPKQVFAVETMPRHPTGKPDYKTAQRVAAEAAS